ncbi:CPBP family intramembrane glutamic endopeptidase [Candidatus Neptunochlamydia vexilliferae]|nr:CPBP family intramembrane glutamic endopeptidase [Candidatus Neptunochlamydia vexilliferae]
MSLWMHRKPWLWGSFLALSFIFALYGKVIDLKIFVALILLGGAHLALTGKLKGVPRLITIIIAIFLSVVLMGHFFPGFYNWKIAGELQISENAYPYSLYLNYDKPFIGFFPLALSIPLLSRFHLRSVFVKTVALTTLGVIVLVILSLYFHLVEIDLKFPHITWVWLIANLFLVVIPEEAFFRGFLQRELSDYLNAKWGGALSVVAVSLFFALLHFTFVRDLGFLSLTFIASLVYGSIYQMTRSIESSIFCHYLFNLIHFFCFTYPALRG